MEKLVSDNFEKLVPTNQLTLGNETMVIIADNPRKVKLSDRNITLNLDYFYILSIASSISTPRFERSLKMTFRNSLMGIIPQPENLPLDQSVEHIVQILLEN